ncbi:carboxypeptidase-like regulatory domain-containing protein [Nonlabens sp.]|uniref:carboxypeptidase-like regulatory domain-containing protein n=1 Tax=Nonlabens sp. TaxID=1888209 RepID=UPI003F698F06
MKKIIFFAICFIAILASCSNDDDANNGNNNDNNNFADNFGANINADFFGRIADPSGIAIAGAVVSVGGQNTTTDSNGLFIIEGANVNEQFAYLKVEKNGFFNASRSLIPTNNASNVQITMLPRALTGSVMSGTSSSVTGADGEQVTFGGDFVDANGNAYNGTVNVYMDFLDPTDNMTQTAMPGMLYGEDENGNEQGLDTFGMIIVELEGASGESLNLADGSPATLCFPVDPSLQGVAPATIPLWFFDEANGYWKEEGLATLNNGEYCGETSHFSFWNCDAPFPIEEVCITVTDDQGNPIAGADVCITTASITYARCGVTDANGEVCGMMPANQVLTIDIIDSCNNITSTQNAGPFTAPAAVTIPIPITSSSVQNISGDLLDCNGLPVTNGYVILDDGTNVSYTNVTGGTFNFSVLVCTTSPNMFTLEGVDLNSLESSGQVSYTYTNPNTNIGSLYTCNTLTEYIEYTLDSNPQKVVTIRLNGSLGAANNPNGFTVSGSTNPNNEFLGLFFQDNALGSYALDGSFTVGMTFFFESSALEIDYNNTGNSVNAQVNANAPNVGDYYDGTFSGSYFDQSGVNHTITGSFHVIRDN